MKIHRTIPVATRIQFWVASVWAAADASYPMAARIHPVERAATAVADFCAKFQVAK